jgi:hypothetical protein
MAGMGEVASVIAVLQLSSKVVDHVGKAKDVSKDRTRLRAEIRDCKHLLQDPEDADDPEDGDSWLETIKTLARPDGPLTRLQSTLAQLEARLRNVNSLRGSWKWP